MPKFRKKPIVIEAIEARFVLYCAAQDKLDELPPWVRAAINTRVMTCTSTSVRIHTREGTIVATRDDWVLRGVEGEIYPCGGAIFEKTYEPVEEVDEDSKRKLARDVFLAFQCSWSSFNCIVLRLLTKSDVQNRAKLRTMYPVLVALYEEWANTAGEIPFYKKYDVAKSLRGPEHDLLVRMIEDYDRKAAS